MTPEASATTLAAIVGCTVLLLGAAILSIRARTNAETLVWMVVGGIAYALFGLAAGMQTADSNGLRSCLVQLIAVFISAALAALVIPKQKPENLPQSSLSALLARLAWLSLIGLPPGVGFHGKLLVYRSLLEVGWMWALVLSMVGSAIALIPFFQMTGSGRCIPIRGLRAMFATGLAVLTMALGAYPALAIDFADFLLGVSFI